MKKVVSIVLNNFKNDSRVLKESISLNKGEYDVSVLALHDGKSDLAEYDIVADIPVHRIYLVTKNLSKNLLMQSIKYLEFLIRAVKECCGVNIVHCNDLNALPVGVLCKFLSLGHVKIVYDAHELETEREGVSGIRKLLLKMVEKSLIGFVDEVITVSDGIAEEYSKLYGLKKPVVVMNAPFYKEVRKNYILHEDLNIEREKKIFLYQGVVSEGNGVRLIVEAFKKIDNEDIVLVVMGYGDLEEWIKVVEKEQSNIYFHEAVSPDSLLEYTASADYGVACIDGRSSLSYYYTLPNKLFEYAMCRLPVVMSDLPEMVKKNNEFEFGIACKYEIESFITAVNKIIRSDYEKMQNGAMQMASACCWEKQERILLNLYDVLEDR